MPRKLCRPLGLILVLVCAACSTPHLASTPPSGSGLVHSPHRTAPPPTGGGIQFASGGEVGYIPCNVSHAYGLDTTGLRGAGTTIAIVDVNDQPTVQSDLHGFDLAFGLPDPPSFQKYTPFGGVLVDQGWGTEITLDVEWAHAAAPGASIALVEVPTAAISNPGSGRDLLAGVGYAVQTLNADVVSMSWTMPESVTAGVFGADNLDAVDARSFPATNGAGRPVTYLAAAGDAGLQTNWPAIATNVVGVGGTSLAPAAYGYSGFPGTHYDCAGASAPAGVNGANETVWGGGNCTSGPPASCSGTGGGPSAFLAKPSWQATFGSGQNRISPDVAMLADPSTGVATFQGGAWNQFLVGGTSLAAPLWAGVVAVLDEARHRMGLANLGLTSSSAWMYRASGGDFNDIVSGGSPPTPGDSCIASGACRAATGYDPVTGRGSPRFASLLGDPAVAACPTAASASVSAAASQTSTNFAVTVSATQVCAVRSFMVGQRDISSGFDQSWVDIAYGLDPASSSGQTYTVSVTARGFAGHGYQFRASTQTITGPTDWSTASATATVSAGAISPSGFPGLYTLDTYGAIHADASPPLTASATWPGWDIARSARGRPGSGGQAGLTLDGYGGLHPFGRNAASTPVRTSAYWAGWDIARDLDFLPGGSSGYVLDGFGGLNPFSLDGAPLPSAVPTVQWGNYWAGWDIARKVVVLPDGRGGYTMDGYGGLHPFAINGNPAPPAVPTIAYQNYWPGWKIARSVVLLPDSTSTSVAGYILDGYGGLHAFAVNHATPPAIAQQQWVTYWVGWDIARGVVLLPGSSAGGVSGYLLDGFGGMHQIAAGQSPPPPAIPSLPEINYWAGRDVARVAFGS